MELYKLTFSKKISLSRRKKLNFLFYKYINIINLKLYTKNLFFNVKLFFLFSYVSLFIIFGKLKLNFFY